MYACVCGVSIGIDSKCHKKKKVAAKFPHEGACVRLYGLIYRRALASVMAPAVIATVNPDGQTQIFASSQGQFMIRQYVSKILAMDIANIRVTPAEIGGGFGVMSWIC